MVSLARAQFVATPRMGALWPESAPGFRDLKIDEDVRAILRFDRGREATWDETLATRAAPQQTLATCSCFFSVGNREPQASCAPVRIGQIFVCQHRLALDGRTAGCALYAGRAPRCRSDTSLLLDRWKWKARSIAAHTFFCQREDRVPRAEAQRFNLTSGTAQ